MKSHLRVFFSFFFSLLLLSSLSFAQGNTGKSALLIIDLEQHEPGQPPADAFQLERTIQQLNKLMKAHPKDKLEIIYIGTRKSEMAQQLKLDPRLRKVSKRFFLKNRPDAFSNPSLHRYLRKQQVNRLFMSGVQSEGALSKSMRTARQLGYNCVIVSDCVADETGAARSQFLRKCESLGYRVMASDMIRPPLSDYSLFRRDIVPTETKVMETAPSLFR
ncbi:MAG: isochorismatase family protein [Bacteroidota bacterium]